MMTLYRASIASLLVQIDLRRVQDQELISVLTFSDRQALG